jgi:hypothetical protein
VDANGHRGNLEIAQHRDTLRYVHTRSGAWKPNAISYGVGDYVYVQREMLDTLDTKTGQRILRVRTVRPDGVLELEGVDARTVRVHMERCAPCHRPDIDGQVDPKLAVPSTDFACTWCRKASDEGSMSTAVRRLQGRLAHGVPGPAPNSGARRGLVPSQVHGGTSPADSQPPLVTVGPRRKCLGPGGESVMGVDMTKWVELIYVEMH